MNNKQEPSNPATAIGRLLATVATLTFSASILAGSILTTTNTGNGITGETKDTVGTPVGVKGIANGFVLGGGSFSAIGVEGVADFSGFGAAGLGTGVKGTGNIYGVYGGATGGSLFSYSYGVYGKGGAFAYGVYSDGDAHVQGRFSVTGDAVHTGDLTVTGITTTYTMDVTGANTNAESTPVCMSSGGRLGYCNADALSYSTKIAYVGDGPGSYTSIAGALLFAGTWCGTPLSTNRCVVKVGPGIHDLGAATQTFLSFISIEGEGADETIITSSAATTFLISATSGIVFRNLTIQNTHAGGAHKAVRISGSTDISFENVKINAYGDADVTGFDVATSSYLAFEDVDISIESANFGFGILIDNLSDNITLRDSNFTGWEKVGATHVGVASSSGLEVDNIKIDSEYTRGINFNDAGTSYVRHSLIQSTLTSILVNDVAANAKMSFSEIGGFTSIAAGTLSCYATIRGASFYPSTCP